MNIFILMFAFGVLSLLAIGVAMIISELIMMFKLDNVKGTIYGVVVLSTVVGLIGSLVTGAFK